MTLSGARIRSRMAFRHGYAINHWSIFMKRRSTAAYLLSALLFVSAFAGVARAEEHTYTDDQLEAAVRKVIRDHPEMLVQAIQEYQNGGKERAAKTIAHMQDDLQNNPHSPIAGNPNGDVTVVEFFDYHCGYCKHFYSTVSQLLDEDKGVKVVFKEFPILTEDSAVAAKAALAVNSIDPSKYFAYHTALMKTQGHYDEDSVTNLAITAGIDQNAFKEAFHNRDVTKEIEHNKEIAETLDITGTPMVIIGTQLIPGAIDLDSLKAKIAAAREAAKNKSS